MKTKLFFFVTVLTVLFYSCKKEAGPAGAQGPQGPAGSANVITVNATVQTSDWYAVDQHLEADIYVSQLTDEIEQSGLVIVYMKNDISSWENMPFIRVYSTYTSYYNYYYLSYLLTITKYDSDNAPVTPSVTEYKIVLIPKATLAKYPKTDWDEYCNAMIDKSL